MADSVIRVENLGKRYELGKARHDTLRDRIAHAFSAPLRRRRGSERDPGEFWALSDLSFEVKRGQVLGIIGPNGAGKSTLLKILSRITEPTSGRVSIRGRVASLLEVGTGFHPELTGRENIFLNGAILGMSRAEIRGKFDEIVAFAEVERFLDTPVKHYSSGMYVRLAFGVAAHLEPEIMIVDEVLAVGDAAFQKKCLGKMESAVQREGRTALFVSHNLHAVRQLCQTALLLEGGRVKASGRAADVINGYTAGLSWGKKSAVPAPPVDLQGRAYFTHCTVETIEGMARPEFGVGEPWAARLGFRADRNFERFVVGVSLIAADGLTVQSAWAEPRALGPGNYEAIFRQRAVTLAAGSYALHVGLSDQEKMIQTFEAARVHVTNERVHGYYQATAGLGFVLNSMEVEVARR